MPVCVLLLPGPGVQPHARPPENLAIETSFYRCVLQRQKSAVKGIEEWGGGVRPVVRSLRERKNGRRLLPWKPFPMQPFLGQVPLAERAEHVGAVTIYGAVSTDSDPGCSSYRANRSKTIQKIRTLLTLVTGQLSWFSNDASDHKYRWYGSTRRWIKNDHARISGSLARP
jgi:hypothetical protein